MTDDEKVLAALKCIANEETEYIDECRAKGCPFAGHGDCGPLAAGFAFALLTQQKKQLTTANDLLEDIAKRDTNWTAYIRRHWNPEPPKVENEVKAEEEAQGKPFGDDPDAEEAAQRLTEVLSQAGVPLLEASDAAGKWILMLQEEITKQLRTEELIRLIRMNPNLNWFEKRRIIRGIRKAARDG